MTKQRVRRIRNPEQYLTGTQYAAMLRERASEVERWLPSMRMVFADLQEHYATAEEVHFALEKNRGRR